MNSTFDASSGLLAAGCTDQTEGLDATETSCCSEENSHVWECQARAEQSLDDLLDVTMDTTAYVSASDFSPLPADISTRDFNATQTIKPETSESSSNATFDAGTHENLGQSPSAINGANGSSSTYSPVSSSGSPESEEFVTVVRRERNDECQPQYSCPPVMKINSDISCDTKPFPTTGEPHTPASNKSCDAIVMACPANEHCITPCSQSGATPISTDRGLMVQVTQSSRRLVSFAPKIKIVPPPIDEESPQDPGSAIADGRVSTEPVEVVNGEHSESVTTPDGAANDDLEPSPLADIPPGQYNPPVDTPPGKELNGCGRVVTDKDRRRSKQLIALDDHALLMTAKKEGRSASWKTLLDCSVIEEDAQPESPKSISDEGNPPLGNDQPSTAPDAEAAPIAAVETKSTFVDWDWDEDMEAMLIAETLQREGYDITGATGDSEALNARIERLMEFYSCRREGKAVPDEGLDEIPEFDVDQYEEHILTEAWFVSKQLSGRDEPANEDEAFASSLDFSPTPLAGSNVGDTVTKQRTGSIFEDSPASSASATVTKNRPTFTRDELRLRLDEFSGSPHPSSFNCTSTPDTQPKASSETVTKPKPVAAVVGVQSPLTHAPPAQARINNAVVDSLRPPPSRTDRRSSDSSSLTRKNTYVKRQELEAIDETKRQLTFDQKNLPQDDYFDSDLENEQPGPARRQQPRVPPGRRRSGAKTHPTALTRAQQNLMAPSYRKQQTGTGPRDDEFYRDLENEGPGPARMQQSGVPHGTRWSGAKTQPAALLRAQQNWIAPLYSKQTGTAQNRSTSVTTAAVTNRSGTSTTRPAGTRASIVHKPSTASIKVSSARRKTTAPSTTAASNKEQVPRTTVSTAPVAKVGAPTSKKVLSTRNSVATADNAHNATKHAIPSNPTPNDPSPGANATFVAPPKPETTSSTAQPSAAAPKPSGLKLPTSIKSRFGFGFKKK